MAVRVALVYHHVGVVTGLWCDDCALPSVVRAVFTVSTAVPGRPPAPSGVLGVVSCTDCGTTILEE